MTQARSLIREDEKVELINEHKGVSTYAHFTFDDNHEAEYVTVDLSTLYYLEGVYTNPESIKRLVGMLLNHYGLEARYMIILNPELPCSEEYAYTCIGGNMTCYLLRALYPQINNVEGVSICQDALARRIPIGVVDWDIALSLARYAVERLHVEKPIVVVLTDGFFKVITVAQRMM
jgi:hypothetical protein